MTTTSSRFRAVWFAVALSLVTAPTTTTVALAAPSAADLETARQLFKQGKDLRDAGDLPGARDKLKAAHALGQTPITGLELGKTHVMLNELIEAREAFLSVGRIPVASDETKKSAEARVEADKLAGEVKPRIPFVKVKIVNAPAGAKLVVTVDGEEIPAVALSQPRAVNPGRRVIVAKAEGAPEARAEIEIKEGETLDVALHIKTKKSKTPPPQDPRPEEPAPPPEPVAPPPPPPPQPAPIAPAPEAPKGKLSPLVPIGFSLAAVGAIAGGVTGALALSKANDVKAACPNGVCSVANKPALDETKTFAMISTISFAAAGAGLVIGIIGLAKGRAPVEPSSAFVRPVIGFGSIGLEGAF